jgi:hypothetical protein
MLTDAVDRPASFLRTVWRFSQEVTLVIERIEPSFSKAFYLDIQRNTATDRSKVYQSLSLGTRTGSSDISREFFTRRSRKVKDLDPMGTLSSGSSFRHEQIPALLVLSKFDIFHITFYFILTPGPIVGAIIVVIHGSQNGHVSIQ